MKDYCSKDYCSVFYGTLSSQGYKISYLLISRGINHNFIISDEYFLIIKSLRKVRELSGFEQICDYIEKYQYIFEFPEIRTWK